MKLSKEAVEDYVVCSSLVYDVALHKRNQTKTGGNG